MFDVDAFDLTEAAPAKINLALHVIGQRADGYHLLDMLVTFAGHGDRLGFVRDDADGFEVSGRFGPLLDGHGQVADNLVVKARSLLRKAARDIGAETPPVKIRLEKNLPIASGIGGGSADAAAALRGLLRFWNITLAPNVLTAIALQIGADVPMCLRSKPLIARGIGEHIDALPAFPSLAMVLGNPLVGVSTPAVFRQLTDKNGPAFDFDGARSRSAESWMSVIASLRNDLEPPARLLCGEIAEISRLMDGQRPDLVRMSGSGATCFALFDNMDAASSAASALQKLRPDWYFQATETIAGGN